MTDDQFDALMTARRQLGYNKGTDALRLILVRGVGIAQAARQAGCGYTAAYNALARFRAWETVLAQAGYTRVQETKFAVAQKNSIDA